MNRAQRRAQCHLERRMNVMLPSEREVAIVAAWKKKRELELKRRLASACREARA